MFVYLKRLATNSKFITISAHILLSFFYSYFISQIPYSLQTVQDIADAALDTDPLMPPPPDFYNIMLYITGINPLISFIFAKLTFRFSVNLINKRNFIGLVFFILSILAMLTFFIYKSQQYDEIYFNFVDAREQ